ncbi:MAG: allantoicase [Pelagibacteraceae bacterium]|jgi:allantoicase|nr:allantoicase [Pelagibacteraceae bacterium]HJO13846.1 allantoicase [Alphaproteobacteria bacterium]MBO6467648.1 allantoicase [Pelagibacteraceae bacterium]MBO6470431.1 allantoicase [Pelagibacteraceae bacterium]MBO6470853.1 allantoicase [Pelagibacteraceae bacterium]|tara:strand:- start:391 stop:1380 length:990 start_codon:yes stop_codon:yes gene_type:complete
MNNKYIIKNTTDLANPLLGTKIVRCTDEFFASARRIINSSPPIFKENVFDSHGKWMDGWETRRRRSKGNDNVIIKLGKPGIIKLVDVDTTFFNGNQPEYAELEGCFSKNSNLKNVKWFKIAKKNKIKPNQSNILKSKSLKTFNFVRLNIFPDGGVARLRLFGDIDLSLQKISNKNIIDLASVINGSQVVACSDEHFGNANNILLPSKSKNMGNGWETRRRRGKGYDWVLLKLGISGYPISFEINTHYFKGNYPDSFSIQGVNNNKKKSINSIIKNSKKWKTIITKTKLKPDNSLKIKMLKKFYKKYNFIKLNIYPDGGISRFRVFGKIK